MPTQLKQSQLVAWCPDCLWWLPEEEIGRRCPSPNCERILVKRRRFVCAKCGCSYVKREDYLQHQHHECY